MKVLYKKLPPDLPKSVAREIVGWHTYKKDCLVRLPQRGRGIKPVMVSCGRCNETFPEIYLGTRIDIVNENGKTLEKEAEIYGPVISLFLCDKCAYKEILNIASSLFCEGCNKQIAWLEAGTNEDNGITIVAGKEYVIKECPNCNKDMKFINIKDAEIREIEEYKKP
jgi:hypothetical protein